MKQIQNQTYFAYGSNMNREQMEYRCPEATIIRVVRLEGYELAFAGMAGNGVATIRPKEGSYVDGVLWRLTPECERGLDFYEGYPRFYGKETLTVKDRLGGSHQAMAYVMNEPFCRSPAMPAKSYLQGILDGCDEHGLDKSPVQEAVQRARQEINAKTKNKEKKRSGRER